MVSIIVELVKSSGEKENIDQLTHVFTTHSLNVPQSLNQTSHNLNATLLLAHIVAVLGIVMLVADVNVRTVKSPVPSVLFLNATFMGSVALGSVQAKVFRDIVSATLVS